MLESHWTHIALDLDVEEAGRNRSPSSHHVDYLADRAVAVKLELAINCEGDSCLDACDLVRITTVAEIYHVSCAVLESKVCTW